MPNFPYHFQYGVSIPAEAGTLFEYLDDPKRLGAHMGKSSWMMAGSKMKYQLDVTNGRSQGSKICLSGKILGITLNVEEVVTQHEPPFRKAWKTVNAPPHDHRQLRNGICD